jgi:hypothetical protein
MSINNVCSEKHDQYKDKTTTHYIDIQSFALILISSESGSHLLDFTRLLSWSIIIWMKISINQSIKRADEVKAY